MGRREFTALLGAGRACPQWAWAQHAERSHRLGWVSVSTVDNFSNCSRLDLAAMRLSCSLGDVQRSIWSGRIPGALWQTLTLAEVGR